MCKYCLLKFKYLLNRNVHKALISIYLEDTTYLEFKNKFLLTRSVHCTQRGLH